jgi:hypothetical protein
VQISNENLSVNIIKASSSPKSTEKHTKTYRNEEWGFEFEYPDDWEVKENIFESYYSKFYVVINPLYTRSSTHTIIVNVVKPEFPEKTFKGFKGKEILINKIKGVRYEYGSENSREIAIVLPLGLNKIILGTIDLKYEQEYEKFLTTFKFIK